MRLIVVGSADASNSAGRGHSCYWLEVGGPAPTSGRRRDLMIDCGGTALMGIKRLGRDPRDLAALLFTHLHGDHIGGFPFLLIDALFEGERSEPLHVVGPVGVEARLMDMARVAYGSLAERERPFALTFEELAPGEVTTVLERVEVRGFAADHMKPPEQPLCLRVTADGRAVAFSGDTRMCDGLRDAARGADLLVAECTHLRQPAGAHTTWEDWQQELPTIGAGRVLLTHLATPVRAAVPQLLQQAPPGVDLDFAEDGLELEV